MLKQNNTKLALYSSTDSYVLTDDEYVIDKLCYTTPLGKSDHVCIELGYLTDHPAQSSSCHKPDYRKIRKTDYKSIRSKLPAINWDTEFHNMTITESQQVLHQKLSLLRDKNIL